MNRTSIGAPEGVLDGLKSEIVLVLGGTVQTGDIRSDIDVFEASDQLVAGRRLDSLDVMTIVAAIEERFGVLLDEVVEAGPGLTLDGIAHVIAGGAR